MCPCLILFSSLVFWFFWSLFYSEYLGSILGKLYEYQIKNLLASLSHKDCLRWWRPHAPAQSCTAPPAAPPCTSQTAAAAGTAVPQPEDLTTGSKQKHIRQLQQLEQLSHSQGIWQPVLNTNILDSCSSWNSCPTAKDLTTGSKHKYIKQLQQLEQLSHSQGIWQPVLNRNILDSYSSWNSCPTAKGSDKRL